MATGFEPLDKPNQPRSFNYPIRTCHQDANQVMVILPVITHDIGECCSTVHAQQKSENKSMLLKILQNIHFLSRQGIAFRGHNYLESNFIQLLNLRA